MFASVIEFMKYRTYENLHVIFVEDVENFYKVFCCNFADNKASHRYTKNFVPCILESNWIQGMYLHYLQTSMRTAQRGIGAVIEIGGWW